MSTMFPSSNGGIKKGAAIATTDNLEEKYLELRDQNMALKKTKNDQEITIKRMYTKLAMIEENLKRKQQGSSNAEKTVGDASSSLRGNTRDIEMEKYVQSLKKENAELRKKNQLLSDRCRKTQNQNVMKVARGNENKSLSLNASSKILRDHSSTIRQKAHNKESDELIKILKERLKTTEKQLVKYQQETEQLRQQSIRSPTNKRSKIAESAMPQVESSDIASLQRDLREKQAQIAILNSRYEHLDSKSKAEREIQERTLEQMEAFNRTIRDLRRKLQQAQLESDEGDARAVKAKELEEEIDTLREQNRRLEERMTALCESPFISDAYMKKERIDQLTQLEKTDRLQKAQIQHLQDSAKKHHSELMDVNNKMKRLQEDKEDSERIIERLKSQIASDASTLARLSQSDLATRSVSTASPVQVTQQALTLVSRKHEDLSQVDFLEQQPGGLDNNDINDVKRRLHTLQVTHLSTTRELERCERMLTAQANINRDLTLEIEELSNRKSASQSVLEAKLTELEQLSSERLQKINELDAQLKHWKYGKSRKGLLSSIVDMEDDGISDTASTTDSLALAANEFSLGENLLELWIMEATFDSTCVAIDSKSCTFVICDFYDFESQTTPLVTGASPQYNFSATFKIIVDEFLLRYFAAEKLVLEVHKTVRGDFQILGQCFIPLRTLLQRSGKMKHQKYPIYSTDDVSSSSNKQNKIIGMLKASIRLAAPIVELWQMHLRSHPQDRNLLPSSFHEISGYDLNAEGGDSNELEISVLACHDLKTSMSELLPSPYVHYQFLGFPDTFTNIVYDARSPRFDANISNQSYTVNVDQSMISFLSKYELIFTVFDDKESNSFKDQGPDGVTGLIGTCKISAKELIYGNAITGAFQILNGADEAVGKLSVRLEWKDSKKIIERMNFGGSNNLNANELNEVFQLFSPAKDGRVDYSMFLKYVAPCKEEEMEILKALRSEMVDNDSPTEARQHKPFQVITVNETQYVSFSAFYDSIRSFESSCSFDQERIRSLFMFFEPVTMNDEKEVIPLSHVQVFLRPIQSTNTRLEHKLRHVMKQYLDGGLINASNPIELFAKYDGAAFGFVSRTDFKRVLGKIGFTFVDEPIMRSNAKAHEKVSEEDAVLNVTRPEAAVEEEEVLNETFSRSAPPSNALTHDATSEFERRKQIFLERMKDASRKVTSGNQTVAQQYKETSTFIASLPSKNYDTPQAIEAARKLQRGYRGYQKKRQLTNDNISLPRDSGHSASISIVGLENKFARALKGENAQQRENDLLRSFEQVDRKSVGFVCRKQFAHAMNQLNHVVALTSAELQFLMHYFNDAKRQEQQQYRINYHQMLEFFKYECPSMPSSSVIVDLNQMNQSNAMMETFASFDKLRNGTVAVKYVPEIISRFYRVRAMSEKTMKRLMNLFQLNGGVSFNYVLFMNYINNSKFTVAFEAILSKLIRVFIKQPGNLKLIQDIFLHFDSKQNGLLTQELFYQAMKDFGIFVTWEEIGILYQKFDSNATGSISYIDFLQHLSQHESSSSQSKLQQPSVPPLTMEELQSLAWNSMREVVLCQDPKLANLYAHFHHYDLHGEDQVGLEEFKEILMASGFVFTEEQITRLSHPFVGKSSSSLTSSKSYRIQYSKFLDWATPPHFDSVETILRLRQLLHKRAREKRMEPIECLQEWKSFFLARDPNQTGWISRAEFSHICSSQVLNLAIHVEEMIQIFDKYDPKYSDEVMYLHFLRLESSSNDEDVQEKNIELAADMAADIVNQFQDQIELLEWSGIEYYMCFQLYDFAGNGFISTSNFIKSLQRLDFKFNPSDVPLLLKSFQDKTVLNKSRVEEVDEEVSYFDFLQEFQLLHEIIRELLEREIFKALRYYTDFNEFYTTLQSELFQQGMSEGSVNNSQTLMELVPFQQLLCMKMNMKFTQKQLQLVFFKFKRKGQHNRNSKIKIRVDDFLSFVQKLERSIAKDMKKVQSFLRLQYAQYHRILQNLVDHGVDYMFACEKLTLHSSSSSSISSSSIIRLADFHSICQQAPSNRSLLDEILQNDSSLSKYMYDSMTGGVTSKAAGGGGEERGINYVELVYINEHMDALFSNRLHVSFWKTSEELRQKIRKKIAWNDFENFKNYFGPPSGSQGGNDVSNNDALDSGGRFDLPNVFLEVFYHFDRDHKGYFTKLELEKGLSALKMNCSLSDINYLFQQMTLHVAQKDTVSRLDFELFLLDPTHAQLMSKMQLQCEELRKSWDQLEDLFKKYDEESTTLSISREHFKLCCHTFGLKLSSEDFIRLQYHFDVNRNHQMSYRLFISFLNSCSDSRRSERKKQLAKKDKKHRQNQSDGEEEEEEEQSDVDDLFPTSRRSLQERRSQSRGDDGKHRQESEDALTARSKKERHESQRKEKSPRTNRRRRGFSDDLDEETFELDSTSDLKRIKKLFVSSLLSHSNASHRNPVDMFRKYDLDHYNAVDFDTLCQLFKKLRVDASTREIKELHEEYTTRGNRFNYLSFLKEFNLWSTSSSVSPSKSKHRSSRSPTKSASININSLVKTIRREMKDKDVSCETLKKHFKRHVLKDGEWEVSCKRFQEGCRQLDIHISSTAINHLRIALDGKHTKRRTLDVSENEDASPRGSIAVLDFLAILSESHDKDKNDDEVSSESSPKKKKKQGGWKDRLGEFEDENDEMNENSRSHEKDAVRGIVTSIQHAIQGKELTLTDFKRRAKMYLNENDGNSMDLHDFQLLLRKLRLLKALSGPEKKQLCSTFRGDYDQKYFSWKHFMKHLMNELLDKAGDVVPPPTSHDEGNHPSTVKKKSPSDRLVNKVVSHLLEERSKKEIQKAFLAANRVGEGNDLELRDVLHLFRKGPLAFLALTVDQCTTFFDAFARRGKFQFHAFFSALDDAASQEEKKKTTKKKKTTGASDSFASASSLKEVKEEVKEDWRPRSRSPTKPSTDRLSSRRPRSLSRSSSSSPSPSRRLNETETDEAAAFKKKNNNNKDGTFSAREKDRKEKDHVGKAKKEPTEKDNAFTSSRSAAATPRSARRFRNGDDLDDDVDVSTVHDEDPTTSSSRKSHEYIQITVTQLKFTSDAFGREAHALVQEKEGRLELAFLPGQGTHQSKPLCVASGAKNLVVSFVKTFPVTTSAMKKKIKQFMSSSTPEIQFMFKTKSMEYKGALNLNIILDDCQDLTHHSIDLLNAKSQKIGSLVVSIHAYQTLNDILYVNPSTA